MSAGPIRFDNGADDAEELIRQFRKNLASLDMIVGRESAVEWPPMKPLPTVADPGSYVIHVLFLMALANDVVVATPQARRAIQIGMTTALARIRDYARNATDAAEACLAEQKLAAEKP